MVEIIASNEQTVLKIINEYLDKNRFFNVNDILPFISSRFAKSGININLNGIRAILKSLVDKNVIVEGSKLTRNEILSNFNRKKIFEYIQENPGTHFYDIVSNLDLNIPVVEWHLNILIKFMYISKEKIENTDAYFDVNVKSEDRIIIYFISKAKCKQIIDYLDENQEGITRYQISERLNMHSTTVTKYTDKLHEIGILIKKSLPNKTLYFLNYKTYNKLS
ncbi:MAG: HTH domain-containing protein [Promethearchaeota archaeon]|jgi:predicted transcriptional regulator